MTREQVFQLLREVPRETVEAFLIFHIKNPLVWKYFLLFALQAARLGKKLGAKAIMERVRWECDIEQKSEVKINNNFIAYYARMAAAKDELLKDFFEFRQITGLKEAA